jgi:hypothetical protein
MVGHFITNYSLIHQSQETTRTDHTENRLMAVDPITMLESHRHWLLHDEA